MRTRAECCLGVEPERLAALLLLADGRFPAGGYAHSGGLEPSIEVDRVRDVASLATFLRYVLPLDEAVAHCMGSGRRRLPVHGSFASLCSVTEGG